MRPQGPARITLAEGMSAGPGPTRDLAARTGLDEATARRTLDNMVKAGQAVKVDARRMPGVRRPVPIYDLADRHPPERPSWGLLQCWSLGRALA